MLRDDAFVVPNATTRRWQCERAGHCWSSTDSTIRAIGFSARKSVELCTHSTHRSICDAGAMCVTVAACARAIVQCGAWLSGRETARLRSNGALVSVRRGQHNSQLLHKRWEHNQRQSSLSNSSTKRACTDRHRDRCTAGVNSAS